MNTIEELTDNGIDIYTAQLMLDDYESKIGTMNGELLITDITFDVKERGKIVSLECPVCGNKLSRLMISGRNKWSELIKSCPACKQRAKEEKIRIAEEKRISREKELEEKRRQREIEKANKEPYVVPIKYGDEYIGRKNNRLTIKAIVRNTDNRRRFLCECDCGNEALVIPILWENGTIKSCGCLLRSRSDNPISHERIYSVWNGMKGRCYNPNDTNYRNYGGRGITICDEWLDFQKFKQWAYATGYDENAPKGECTIDRINVNGNYEPTNCRWADMKTQANNKRPSSEWQPRKPRKRMEWTIDGKTKEREQWCKEYGLELPTVLYRINIKGMSIKEALATPRNPNGRKKIV